MNWDAISFDWNQLRAFLATVEEGSLSAAARALGQTQPTLSRQVAALEEDLGVTLFERGPRTMDLTDTGARLLEHVKDIGESAMRLSIAASGQSKAIDGSVTVTVADMTAAYLMPPILMDLRLKAPRIQIDLVVSNEVRDLVKREADIAIRHGRPEQPDLIARHIRDCAAHFCASQKYLQRVGTPNSIRGLSALEFLGPSPLNTILPELQTGGFDLTDENFKFISTSGVAIAEMARHGGGVTIMPNSIIEQIPELVPIMPEEISFNVPVWLVTHRELHTSPRIRLVFDHLAEAVAGVF